MGILWMTKRHPRVIQLMVGLHHESQTMVKLEVRLHHRCSDSDQEVSQNGEARDWASPREFEGCGVHDEASPWKFRGR